MHTMVESRPIMETIFENRKVSTGQPGYKDMQDFFMARNPGAIGMMLGEYGDLDLPTPVFLDALRTGLLGKDAEALEFRYRSIADFMGARNVKVGYDREGWPWVNVRGNAFPNVHVSSDMAFLKNGAMAWGSNVFSDRFLLKQWDKYELEKFETEDGMIQLDVGGFYQQTADAPGIAEQLYKYPDLVEVVTQLRTRDEDPLTEEVRGVLATTFRGGWSIHVDNPPSPAHKRVMEDYRVFKYRARVDCFVPTLNQIVGETKMRVPEMQRIYMAAQDKFMS